MVLQVWLQTRHKRTLAAEKLVRLLVFRLDVILQQWTESGQKVDRKWTESGQKVDRKWTESGQKVGRKWTESGQKVDTKWTQSGHKVDAMAVVWTTGSLNSRTRRH